jgi:dTDP-4-amino-4,6-dideoxygalactose transaminase
MEIAYEEVLRTIPGNPCARRTIVPLNRLESRSWDLLAALAWARHSDPLAALRDELRNVTGRQQIFFAPSARCALAQVLLSLPHREVVMSAYTCWAVRAAAEVAGKRIIYVDVASNGVNATSAEFADAAKPGRILLVTHLFGVPTDIEAICELAKYRNCLTIEDAAGAFGGRRNGRLLGTFGDFGFFSFHSSKRLPALRGAALIVNNDLILDPTKLGASRVVKSKRAIPIRELARALVYNIAATPWIYGRFTLPQLLRRYRQVPATGNTNGLAAVTRSPEFTREFHPYQAELALRVLRRLDTTCQQIARLAAIYVDAFRDEPIATFLPPECDYAGLMRFPIAFPGTERAEILRSALKRGLYLEVEFERLLPPESERTQFPNALWMAQNLLLLPLYSALSPQSAEVVAQRVIGIQKSAVTI